MDVAETSYSNNHVNKASVISPHPNSTPLQARIRSSSLWQYIFSASPPLAPRKTLLWAGCSFGGKSYVTQMVMMLTGSPDVPGSNVSRGTDGFHG